MNQKKTPLYSKLVEHSDQQPISFHVPGHKYGSVFPPEAAGNFQKVLRFDATELTGLDDLHSVHGVIGEAEELLADCYRAQRSFFLINGTTVGNLAMILAVLGENDIVLVQRNCHKSILNGIRLAKACPVFLGPVQENEWHVAGGVAVKTVERALELYPNAKAVILTYPNYYGLTFDVKSIIELAHSFHIPVLIDEAHGAHFIAGKPFPPSAVELGADLTVQSAHKTLPAMTMGSFLHFNSKLVPIEPLKNYLQMLQSSSPSYPIMASLDLARSYLGTYSPKDVHTLEENLHAFRSELENLNGIRALPLHTLKTDPLKITIQSTGSISGYELQDAFESAGIYPEMADPSNVLLVFPLLKKGMDFPVETIMERMSKAVRDLPKNHLKNKLEPLNYFNKPEISALVTEQLAAEQAETKFVSIQDAAGLISAETITPYPPGIPLLFPGERITAEDAEAIRLLTESGGRFQGGELLTEGKMKVFR